MNKLKIIKEYGFENIKNALSCTFNEHIKLNGISLKQFENKIKDFTVSRYKESSIKPYKIYPGSPLISLCSIKNNYGGNIADIIKRRRSIRTYKEHNIKLSEISYLINNSYGISKIVDVDIDGNLQKIGLRNVPSAGALYPLELYFAVYGSDIKDGIYHYRVDINAVELIKDNISKENLSHIVNASPVVDLENASMVVFISSVTERYFLKYGDRGYKFMLQESGFVMENITLLSVSLGLGSCILGGFLDDHVNHLLGLDGLFETVNSVIVIGKE